MKRIITLAATALAILGACGMGFLGAAIVQVVSDVFTFRITNPPPPLPSSFAAIQQVVISAVALVLGVMVASTVIAIAASSKPVQTRRTRLLFGLSGVFLVIASALFVSSTMVGRNVLIFLGRTSTAPTPDHFQAPLATAETLWLAGCGTLLISLASLLAAGLFATAETRQPATAVPRKGVPMAAISSLVLGCLVLLLFMLISVTGKQVEQILSGPANVPIRPAELAGRLLGLLHSSIIAFVVFGVMGAINTLAPVFWRQPGNEEGLGIEEGLGSDQGQLNPTND